MLVTLEGMITPVTVVLPPNAEAPMAVTGTPIIAAGIVIAPPVPV
jgi:hypothetical protein